MELKEFCDKLLTLRKGKKNREIFIKSTEHPPEKIGLYLKEKGRSYHNNWKEAKWIAKICLEVTDVLKSEPCRAYGEIALANAYMFGKRYEQAELHYNRARQIWLELDNPIEAAKTQPGKITCLLESSLPGKALNLANELSLFFEKHNMPESRANIEAAKGNIYKKLGNYQKALECYDLADKIYQQSENRQWWVLYNKAGIHLQLGELENLEDTYQEIETLSIKTTFLRAYLQLGRSIAEVIQGNFHKAINLIYDAKTQALKAKNMDFAQYSDLHLSRIYFYLGRFNEVLDICNQNIHTTKKDKSPLHKFRFNAACAHISLKNFQQAKQQLDWLKKHAPELKHKISLMSGKLYLLKNQPQKAILHFQRSIAASKNQKNLLSEGLARLKLVRAYLSINNILMAKKELEHLFIEIISVKHFPELSGKYYHLLAIVENLQGYKETAYQFIQLAINHLDKIVSSVVGAEELQMSLMSLYLEVYEDAILLALESGDIKTALIYAEKAKARSLWDNIVRHIDVRLYLQDDEDKNLQEQLNHLYRQLAEDYHKKNKQPNDDKRPVITQFDAQIQNTESKINSIYERWRRKSIFHQNFVDLRPNLPAPSFNFLTEDELLLEYFTIGNKIIRFEITKGSVKSTVIKTPLEEICSLYKEFRYYLNKPDYRNELNDILHDLYIFLLQDIDISPYNSLTIVPHNMLHYLPFHCFYTGDYYLIDKLPVRYGHSSSLLDLCHNRDENIGDTDNIMAVGVSHTLPYVSQELEYIKKQFEHSYILADQKVNKEVLITHSSDYHIFHISTHAHLNFSFPYLSYLKLSESSKDKNFMFTLSDIYQMQLPKTRLAFLNACDTALGKIAGGDEVIGFARGFFYAGVSSVIQSFWQINDEASAEFAKYFYENLDRNNSIARSLQSAQLTMKDIDKWQHPYFWGGFGLWGKD